MKAVVQLKAQLKYGVTPAMATPVKDNGFEVNLDVVPDLVSFLSDRGIRALFVGGTTGEGICFSSDQRQRLLERVIAAAGSLPVLAHVGALTTRETVDLAQHAATAGAAAVVVITPWFFKMGDDALLTYFQEVAAAVPDSPFLVYDIPQAAVNGITPALLTRLQETIPNFGGLKCSRTDLQIMRALLSVRDENHIFLAGNETIALGTLALGADGIISGLSTAIPEPFVELTAAVGRSDLPAARQAQKVIQQLLDALPAERLGGIKKILQARGIAVGSTVPPRPMPVVPSVALWERLGRVLVPAEPQEA